MKQELMNDFFKFCRDMDFDNKSLSQLAVLWMLVLFKAPQNLGEFAARTLSNAASSQGTGESWRDVLPLPVPAGVYDTVTKVVENNGFSFKKTGLTGNQVQSEYRRVGIDCLVFGIVTSLNYLWGGMRRGGRVHSGPWRGHHHNALNHITEAASYMIDSKDSGSGKGVPRTPIGSWRTRFKMQGSHTMVKL